MTPVIAEFVGTFLLILLGVGVNANNTLDKTYARNSGWPLITAGWGLAVFVAVVVAGPISGAHINPAVSIGLAFAGKFSWAEVPGYVIAQLAGAMLGAFTVWLAYKQHYKQTDDNAAKLGTFSTAPAIKHLPANFFNELIGTFVLVFVVLYMTGASLEAESLENVRVGLGSIGALPVALLVTVIGMSLGGTTGYAINPARDFGPRVVHALVPMDKGTSNWSYAWVPVFGPIAGAVIAALLFVAFQ